jgi:hypothetical protein
MALELWKTVVDGAGRDTGYQVSRNGRVRKWLQGERRWRPIQPHWASGNLSVTLGPKGARRSFRLAALVLRAFAGPRPIGCAPLHYPDPDPANCRADNLRWAPKGASRVGDRRVAANLPEQVKGARHHNARLTPGQVRQARAWYREGWHTREIAGELGVSQASVLSLLKGLTYTDVPDPLGPVVIRPRGQAGGFNNGAMMGPETAAAIKRRLAAGEARRTIAEDLGMPVSRVDRIAQGRAWMGVGP